MCNLIMFLLPEKQPLLLPIKPSCHQRCQICLHLDGCDSGVGSESTYFQNTRRVQILKERTPLCAFQKGSEMIMCSIVASWPSGSPTRATASTGQTEALSILSSPRTSAFTFSPQTSAGMRLRFLIPHHLPEGMKVNCWWQLMEHTVPYSGENKREIQRSPRQVQKGFPGVSWGIFCLWLSS